MRSTASDDTTTDTREGPAPYRGSSPRVPVLIVVGHAPEGGGERGGELVIAFEDAVEIGRKPESSGKTVACRLADDRLSRRHVSVVRTQDGFKITDLGSKNGTLVEGQPLSRTTKGGDGTLLFAGGHALLLRLLPEEWLAAVREDLATPFGPVATLSGVMAHAIRRLRRRAGGGDAILLAGETGVGKDVYARAVHRASGRGGRLVAVNCAALPTELVESELFGFVRGAHAQAMANKPGLIEQAQGGTLFLDEIGSMPGAAQAKLLRFLEDHRYVPLGAKEARTLDVRIIGAASGQKDDSHGLRPELLARFGAEPVVLPALRHRREDIGRLARHFLGSGRSLEPTAFLALCMHDWPKNVRELEKMMGEAMRYANGRTETVLEDLPARLREVVPEDVEAGDSPARRPRPDKATLEALVERHHGNVAEVARALDRKWNVVWRWMRQDGVAVGKYRK